MRRVADQLENLRASIEEKDLYQAWRDVDRAVGQVLLQENEELYDILNTFRQSFVDWAYELAMAQAPTTSTVRRGRRPGGGCRSTGSRSPRPSSSTAR